MSLNERGKLHFLKLLAKEFAADRDLINERIATLQSAKDDLAFTQAEMALRDVLHPPRMQILRQFNALPEGVKFLVDLRADLLNLRRKHPDIKGLELDLKRLLANWFDIGMLDMIQITWDASAALLEKLVTYEAVHQIRDWNDLKNRLNSDRLCFAFFHYKMPKEPLIFVEVALMDSIPNNIHEVLDTEQPDADLSKVDTAVFYSISNAQRGLNGISFGNFLIKRVVDQLSHDYPNLKRFVTLSPIPGFSKWLLPALKERGNDLLKKEEIKQLQNLPGKGSASEKLRHTLDTQWYKKDAHIKTLEKPLIRLAAHYLLKEKRGSGALDPVANFHLTNGAQIERINWLANTSKRGIDESFGIMVNYYYKLNDIDAYHELYRSGKSIAASKQVKGLAK